MSPILNSILSVSYPQHQPNQYRTLSSWLVNLVCQQPIFDSHAQSVQSPVHAPQDIKNTADERSIEQLVEYAKQKLRTPQMPHFMKITVYLRFCCLAIQKSLSEEHQALVSNFYHDLLQWLWECEPNWWEQCFITDADRIASNNIQIQDLLQPLEDFVSQFSEG